MCTSKHIQSLLEFGAFVLKILSGNKILTSIKGHNFVTNEPNMSGNNLDIDLVNMHAYIKCGDILSICSQNIEQK